MNEQLTAKVNKDHFTNGLFEGKDERIPLLFKITVFHLPFSLHGQASNNNYSTYLLSISQFI